MQQVRITKRSKDLASELLPGSYEPGAEPDPEHERLNARSFGSGFYFDHVTVTDLEFRHELVDEHEPSLTSEVTKKGPVAAGPFSLQEFLQAS